MSDFIENRDVVKIYSGLSLAVMISIPVQVSFIYLVDPEQFSKAALARALLPY